MLSLIICSRKSDISEVLKINIQKTIGIEYELIIIDNSKGLYSIFSAYNEGLRRAKFSILCFMHDDILFHTTDWGIKVIEHFKNSKLGIIGVAGSHYLPKLPSSHWSSEIRSYNVIQTVQNTTSFDFLRYTNDNELSEQAVLLDGLWLCIAREIFEKSSFDDITFNGFHCYDSDICLQIRKLKYDVKIVFDITIEHFSLGVKDQLWLKNIFRLYNKWKAELPISTVNLTTEQISLANYLNAKELLDQIRVNKNGWFYTLKTWYYYLHCNPITNKKHCEFALNLINDKFYLKIKKKHTLFVKCISLK